MGKNDLESRVVSYFDCVANTVPSSYYIGTDNGELENFDTIDHLSVGSREKGRKSRLQRSRYDPNNWRCTSDLLFLTASTSMEPRKRPLKRKDLRQSGGKKSESENLSRDDLRKRLHEKIATLQQQQQKKTQKYSKEEAKAFRKLKRSQNRHQGCCEQPTQQSKNEEIKVDFAFNNVINRGTPSKEKRKGEMLVANGVKVVKRRRMLDALKDAERKEKERSCWTPQKKEEVERKEALEKAMLRATGEKVFDDPRKIRKALKVKNRQVAKSAKNWNEKKKAVEDKQKEASDKRRRNVLERIDKIKAKKH